MANCAWCEEHIDGPGAMDAEGKEYHSECRDEMVFLREWKEMVAL